MTAPAGIPSPSEFFSKLRWLDQTPLLDVIEPYRRQIFEDVLYSFDDDGRPSYNLALLGRAKKNWKSADLVLAALYRLLIWPSALGNDAYILANDEDQAGDDLSIAKRLIEANPILAEDLEVQSKRLVRRDGRGEMRILPAGDVAGMHGKSYCFVGYDEIHGYRDWSVFEAMQPDPTRVDALQWITSYNSLFQSAGYPLADLIQAGKAGKDPRMYFSWYGSDYCSDAALEEGTTAEERANPSMLSWADSHYLEQQKQRLPSSQYRRLHLNLPGSPSGAALAAELVLEAIQEGQEYLKPEPGLQYFGFVDMSGGSNDDCVLAISHWDEAREIAVVDHVLDQGARAPFSPRRAIKRFADVLRQYRISRVEGDAYGGQTHRMDFEDEEISYEVTAYTKSSLYELLEAKLNTVSVELPDRPRLQEQLCGLVWRGSKIDHQAGGHDDWANAVAGAAMLASHPWNPSSEDFWVGDDGSLGAQMRMLAEGGASPAECRLMSDPPTRPWERDDENSRIPRPIVIA
jgi:hypothetical protein